MTALEYFLKELHKEQTGNMNDLIDKVLEMEKQQISEAFYAEKVVWTETIDEPGRLTLENKIKYKDAEDYFNKNFKTKK
jgi:hypothetical protein